MADLHDDLNKQALDNLMFEDRVFPVPESFKNGANVKDNQLFELAQNDRLEYWAHWARKLDWFSPWNKILQWDSPYSKWFIGGKLNASYNCLVRHINNGLGSKIAIYWEGENGDSRKVTYQEAYDEVNKLANALLELKVKKGDRVAIYMPMIPEAAYAMLACARIGAVHSVVFGGFSSEALSERINDSQCKILITADGGFRRGSIVDLKAVADKALESSPTIERVIVAQRTKNPVVMKSGRDIWYQDAVRCVSAVCPPESMDSEDLLYILYTSGSTGKPKGIMHTTGGYLTGVFATTQMVFDLKPSDIFWCTADVGWVTGHSYFVYGPMSNAATQIMYEGAPDFPERNRFWKIIEKYKATILYTAPTAIRAFMKWGTDWPKGCDLSSLRLLGSVGEPINPEAWIWYHENIGSSRCPIVDTWWQTETGAIMICPLPGITPLKPGSATKALPGFEVDVLTESGDSIAKGGGILGVRSPWPSMLRGIWGNPQRYKDTYWNKWEGKFYFPGDGVVRDKAGYLWLMGRIDDVMLIAGHNIGTAEVESALVDHKAVAESAVIGVKDDVKGQAIVAFVILKEGNAA
ncbi:MAG: acetate--CoA ligase, partial [Candidatus Omnitrophica bacterium]|nr:acetate--CoA ligase [Candidatus Omnitrophota bacterium]